MRSSRPVPASAGGGSARAIVVFLAVVLIVAVTVNWLFYARVASRYVDVVDLYETCQIDFQHEAKQGEGWRQQKLKREEELSGEISLLQKDVLRLKEHLASREQSLNAVTEEAEVLENEVRALKDKLSTKEASNHAWRLAIGIPTVSRPGHYYLTHTVKGLLDQIDAAPAGSLLKKTSVVVVNNHPGAHPEFEDVRKRHEANIHAVFIDNTHGFRDPQPDMPEPDDFNNPNDRPGKRVRQQTADIATLADLGSGRSEYFMFMEDDFVPCDHALDAVYYAIEKATIIRPEFRSLRVSYGMNGVIIHSKDLPEFSKFMIDQAAVRPPDHLVVWWMAGKKPQPATMRNHVIFRWNLLFHIGGVSSLRKTKSALPPPQCWKDYHYVLWQHEAFQPGCNNNDMTPCDARGVDTSWVGQLLNKARVDGKRSIMLKGDALGTAQFGERRDFNMQAFDRPLDDAPA